MINSYLALIFGRVECVVARETDEICLFVFRAALMGTQVQNPLPVRNIPNHMGIQRRSQPGIFNPQRDLPRPLEKSPSFPKLKEAQ